MDEGKQNLININHILLIAINFPLASTRHNLSSSDNRYLQYRLDFYLSPLSNWWIRTRNCNPYIPLPY